MLIKTGTRISRVAVQAFYGKVVTSLAIVYLLIATFPGYYAPLNSGLDTSWVYALNYLPLTEYQFGRDIAFTFGPLGYLLNPLDIDNNHLKAIAFWLVIHWALALTLLHDLWARGRIVRVAIFTIGYLLAATAGLGVDYALLTVVALLVTLDVPRGSHFANSASIVAGMLAGLSLFIKFNLGLAAIVFLTALPVLWLIIRDRSSLAHSSWALGSAIVTALLVGVFVLDGPTNFLFWVRGSYEIAAGYSAAMSVPAHPAIVAAGLVSLASLALIALSLALLREFRTAALAVALSGPVFVAFKHGFVRHQGRIFFPFLLAVLALLTLRSSKVRSAILSIAGFIIVFALARFSVPYDTCDCHTPMTPTRMISAAPGMENLRALVNLKDTLDVLEAQSITNLEPQRLPSSWTEKIGNGSVGVIPWELSYVVANQLKWSPYPTLGTYSAYTPFLDGWGGRHYSGEQSPEYVLVKFEDIDGRHPMMGAPQTWRSLLQHYRFADFDAATGLFLLERESQRSQALREIERTRGRFHEQIPIPETPTLVASIDLQLSGTGRVREFFFSIPIVEIEVIWSDGRRQPYRLIPSTSREGILLNPLPRDPQEFRMFLMKDLTPSVQSFSIRGPGSPFYEPEFEIVWLVDR